MGGGVTIRVRRFRSQLPLGTKLALGTQYRYEAPGEPQVKTVKTK